MWINKIDQQEWEKSDVAVIEGTRVGRKHTIKFKFELEEGDVFEIKKNPFGFPKIDTSCACVLANFNEKENTIEVDFVPNPVPKHLVEKRIDYYNTVKEVVVQYTLNNTYHHRALLIKAFVKG